MPEGLGKKMFERGELMPLMPALAPIIDSIIPNSAAALAGLQTGDRLIALNNQDITYWGDLSSLIKGKGKQDITLIVERERSRQTLQFSTDEEGTIGVFPKRPIINFNNEKLSFGQSIVEGFDYAYWTLYDYVSQFQYIFTQKGASQLGGFGAIGNMFPDTWDWKGFWSSTALISIILAFMNILPIPALDGGHVMFLVYEMITGRKPNDKFMEYAQMFGFFLLMSLVLYANGNDLYRLLFN
jgi:regulator of sigma E protease